MRRGFGALVAAMVVTAPATAMSWQIEDPIHGACHETISAAALEMVGYLGTPPPLTEQEAQIRDNLQFDAGRYPANPWALALVIGARYPDLMGAPSFDFDDLAAVHNAPTGQGEHCLRAEHHDGPQGDVRALADCRATIEGLYWRAVAGLEAGGEPDPSLKEEVRLNGPYAGAQDVPLSAFYFYAGRALHAVQDSFTHTYRAPDWQRVRHVFNWVEQVSCSLDEPVDGHGHESALDVCEDPDLPQTERLNAATAASIDFLAALTEPSTRQERRARLDAFFEEWMQHESGCTLDNNYCGDPTHQALEGADFSDGPICEGSCTIAALPPQAPLRPPASPLLLLLLPGLLLARRRRGRQSAAGLVVLLALIVVCATATAQTTPAEDAPDAPVVGDHTGYHTELRASMSVQNAGYAVGAAALWSWPRFEVGAFAELNPWYSVERGRMSLGALNYGALFHYLQPLGSPDIKMRIGLGAGLSTLAEEAIGAEAGTTGPYLNLRLLGIMWYFDSGVALAVDGFDLALAAPQLIGWPILYAQHRISFSLRF